MSDSSDRIDALEQRVSELTKQLARVSSVARRFEPIGPRRNDFGDIKKRLDEQKSKFKNFLLTPEGQQLKEAMKNMNKDAAQPLRSEGEQQVDEPAQASGARAHMTEKIKRAFDPDRLTQMFDQQESFMRLLQRERSFPEFPVDLKSKSGQKAIKGIANDCVFELFEAVQLLKNSKDHRATEIRDLDRAAFVEELVDALHYYFEVAILAGVSADELCDAYLAKGKINETRIQKGY